MLRLTVYTIVSCCCAMAQEESFWVSAHADFIAGSQGSLELPCHAHDPAKDIYVQGVDLGFNMQPTDWLSGFVNVNTFETEDGLDAEWEEGFIKLTDNTYGFELRGGRFLNRVGTQNATHLHAWNYADANLSTANFLGDEGLVSEGAELSWGADFNQGFFYVSAAYGQAVEHDHHDEEHDEEEHDEHEEAGFSDEVFSLRALTRYNYTDYHQNTLGLNYVTGTSGDSPSLYGVDYRYEWRENGLESGGRALSLQGEYYSLDSGDHTQGSYMLDGTYHIGNGWSLGARYEWIEFLHEEHHEEEHHDGEEEGLKSRQRLSAALTYAHIFNEDWSGRARLQYNHDWIDGGENRDAVWLQLGFSYGGGEIR